MENSQTQNHLNGAYKDSQPILEVKNLHVSFKRDSDWTTVVNDLSFAVYPGETLAIVGESGSGKSVSAMSILNLLPQNTSDRKGSIQLLGRELISLPEVEMKKVRGNEIAMIFQEPMTSLNPVMRIGDQIAESLKLHRHLNDQQAKKEALRLMDKVHIPASAERYRDYPHQFSGGMRQRVMIAIALACNPALLIADEPTTALDVTIQAQILELIRELQAEQEMAVVFITHDMGVVAEIADRTLVMCRGEQIETGETKQIFQYPQAHYTKALLSAVPQLGSMSHETQPKPFEIYGQVDNRSPDHEMRDKEHSLKHASEVLQVSGLTMRFDVKSPLLRRVTGRVHAVEDLSFSLNSGETLAIVGESGCGKSTTGKLISGLLTPSSGQILLNGQDIQHLGRLERARKIQMIFQDPYSSLNPRQMIGDALTESLHVHGLATKAQCPAIALELLEKVGLPKDSMHRYPHEFSGGQRQRICIARALALKPEVIIADEAVSALDVSVKVQIVNLLLELQKELGLGLIFISHDMAVVERVSHRVAVMYMGEIVEIGPRQAVFNSPQHAYTKRLLEAVPIPDPTRQKERKMAVMELKTPFKPKDYLPPARSYETASEGHFFLLHTDDGILPV